MPAHKRVWEQRCFGCFVYIAFSTLWYKIIVRLAKLLQKQCPLTLDAPTFSVCKRKQNIFAVHPEGRPSLTQLWSLCRRRVFSSLVKVVAFFFSGPFCSTCCTVRGKRVLEGGGYWAMQDCFVENTKLSFFWLFCSSQFFLSGGRG